MLNHYNNYLLYSYLIMMQCWQTDPQDRPSFVDLRSKFDTMLSEQKNATELYIELSLDQKQPQPNPNGDGNQEYPKNGNISELSTSHFGGNGKKTTVIADQCTLVPSNPYVEGPCM